VLREAAAREDLNGAETLLASCAQALEALQEPEDEVIEESDLDEAQRQATAGHNRVKELEMLLNRQQGALEQVGGQYIEEQAHQVEEAIESIAAREHSLDVEYSAWQLLRTTLAEAEKEGSVHLGNARVDPVSRRRAELTAGRYGNIAIDPQLKATGIQVGGEEREFEVLSVGTQEQIALLLRLSIAEALGTFVILDDQLTQSDPARMAWMRQLLDRAAQKIQIVVLTCHPQDYLSGGSDANAVDLVGCVRRTVVAGSSETLRTSAVIRSGYETERVTSRKVGGDKFEQTNAKTASRQTDPTALEPASPTRRRRRHEKTDPDANLAEALRRSLGRKNGADPKSDT
jgi:uncharacterized protein YhaN